MRRSSVAHSDVNAGLCNSPSRKGQPPKHTISKYRSEGTHAVCADPFGVVTSSSRRKVTWPENQRIAAPQTEDERQRMTIGEFEECNQKWRLVPVTSQQHSDTIVRSRGTQNFVRLHNNIERMQSEVQSFFEEQMRKAIETNPHVVARLRRAAHEGLVPPEEDAEMCDYQQDLLDQLITRIYELRQSSMRFMSMFLNDEDKRHIGARLHYMFGDDAEDEQLPPHRRYVPQRVLDATFTQRELEAAAAVSRASSRLAHEGDTATVGSRHRHSKPRKGGATTAESEMDSQRSSPSGRRGHGGGMDGGAQEPADEDERYQNERDQEHQQVKRRKETKATKNGKGEERHRKARRGVTESEVAMLPTSVSAQRRPSASRSVASTFGGTVDDDMMRLNSNDPDVNDFMSVDEVPLPWPVNVRHGSESSRGGSSPASRSNNSSKKNSPRKQSKETRKKNVSNDRPPSETAAPRKNGTTVSGSPQSATVLESASGNVPINGGVTHVTSMKKSSLKTDPILAKGNSIEAHKDTAVGDSFVSVQDKETDADLYDEVQNGQLSLSPRSRLRQQEEEADKRRLDERKMEQERMAAVREEQKRDQDRIAAIRQTVQEELERDRRERHRVEEERRLFVADEAAIAAQVAAEEALRQAQEEAAKRRELEQRLKELEAERDAEKLRHSEERAAATTVIASVAARDASLESHQPSLSSIHSADSDFTKELKKRQAQPSPKTIKGRRNTSSKRRSGGSPGPAETSLSQSRRGNRGTSETPHRASRDGLNTEDEVDALNTTTAVHSVGVADGVERIDLVPRPTKTSRLKLQEGEFHRHGHKPTYRMSLGSIIEDIHHHRREYHHSAGARISPRRHLTPRKHTVLGNELPLQFTTRARSIPVPRYVTPPPPPPEETEKKKSAKKTSTKKEKVESKADDTPPAKAKVGRSAQKKKSRSSSTNPPQPQTETTPVRLSKTTAPASQPRTSDPQQGVTRSSSRATSAATGRSRKGGSAGIPDS